MDTEAAVGTRSSSAFGVFLRFVRPPAIPDKNETNPSFAEEKTETEALAGTNGKDFGGAGTPTVFLATTRGD